MPAQRFEGERVEERVGEGQRERERDIKSAHTRERKREGKHFGSSFYMFSST